jgi:ribosomal protein L37AE/L43A
MSIIDKKAVKYFQKIDTVHGICEECEEEAILVAIVSEFYRCTNCGHDTKNNTLMEELDI